MTETGCVLAAESVTGKDSGVVPALPSVTDASPTDTDGRPWIRYVATRDVFVAPSLIATATLSVLPVALAGTTSETRAVPPLNDSVCCTTRPAIEGSPVIVPRRKGLPLSLRVTLNETVNGRPAAGCAGEATGFAITGRPPLLGVPFRAAGTIVNEPTSTAPTRPPDTRLRLNILDRMEHLLERGMGRQGRRRR